MDVPAGINGAPRQRSTFLGLHMESQKRRRGRSSGHGRQRAREPRLRRRLGQRQREQRLRRQRHLTSGNGLLVFQKQRETVPAAAGIGARVTLTSQLLLAAVRRAFGSSLLQKQRGVAGSGELPRRRNVAASLV